MGKVYFTLAGVNHYFGSDFMKKGMEAQTQQAAQMIQKMMPSTPGLGEHIDVYA